MLQRVGVLLVGVSFFAGVLGCVSLDTYQLKEEEVQSLTSLNRDMEARNRSLRAEKFGLEIRVDGLMKDNEGLEYRVEKQNKEIAFLKDWSQTLEKDGDVLRSRLEKLNVKIADLDKENQRLLVLSLPENLLRSLGARFTELERQVESLSGENEKLKKRQIIFLPEEKQSNGAEAVKTVEAAGGKQQSVLVSSGQKAEDSEPVKPQAAPEERATPFIVLP